MGIKKKQAAGMKPQELENRLKTAYDQGHYDGYVAAILDVHQSWVDVTNSTKGLGPVLKQRVIDSALASMEKKATDKFGVPSDDVTSLRQALKETEFLTNG